MLDRMISTELVEEDITIENNLRPQNLDDYIGQEKVKQNLRIFIEAAKSRGESLDFFTDRRDLERLRWLASSPMRWKYT